MAALFLLNAPPSYEIPFYARAEINPNPDNILKQKIKKYNFQTIVLTWITTYDILDLKIA